MSKINGKSATFRRVQTKSGNSKAKKVRAITSKAKLPECIYGENMSCQNNRQCETCEINDVFTCLALEILDKERQSEVSMYE